MGISAPTEPFGFDGIPKLRFGAGGLSDVPGLAHAISDRVMLITGGHSFVESDRFAPFAKALDAVVHCRIHSEPSPEQVDAAVVAGVGMIEVVVAVGGGAAIDAGKAISAMLPLGSPVTSYLEGVGTEQHPGSKVPFIAVPTTAGTGAEATKNAVISSVGPDGFKKSLRHDRFIPDWVVIDPNLATSCPPNITAACGMDALTQLLESYVSPEASVLTDALAWSGLELVVENLVSACTDGADDTQVRGAMAYGAFLSGVTLAHAGLGIVHGLASPIGGFFSVPHGVACATLVASATATNIAALRSAGADASVSLAKYARVGRLISGVPNQSTADACGALEQTLEQWTRELSIPLLSRYGIGVDEIPKILDGAGMKQNPVSLSQDQIREILEARI